MKKLFVVLVFCMLAMFVPGFKARAQTLPAPNQGPLLISGVSPSQISDTNATITWLTTLPSTGLVEYGLTSSYGSSSGENQNLVLAHTAVMSGLEPGTTYHYRVSSTDILGTTQSSPDNTLTTTCSSGCDDDPPPVIPPPDNDSTTNNYIFNNPAPTASAGSNQTAPTSPPIIAPPPAPAAQSNSSSGSPVVAQRNPVAPAERNSVRQPLLPVDNGSLSADSGFNIPNSYIKWLIWLLLLFLLGCGLLWAFSPLRSERHKHRHRKTAGTTVD